MAPESDAPDYTTTLGGAEAVFRWHTTERAYLGTCPKCGGVVELRAYDDGDDRWDEAYACRECAAHWWI